MSRRRNDSYDDYDDDDEFDDRPRRRRPRKNSGMPGWVIGLIVLSVLCVIVVPISIALLLPAVQKVREATDASTNERDNLKRLGIATHAHHDNGFRLAGMYAMQLTGPNRQLSGRVELLPYLNHSDTYNQFNRDEAWDSPTNRPLANKPIDAFISLQDPPEEVRTRYLGFAGPGAMYDPNTVTLRLTSLTDGTSNTIMKVVAEDQAYYSQPQEIPFSPGMQIKPTLKLMGSTMVVLMADGSVRAISGNVSEQALHAAVTYNGGEVSSLD